MGVNDFFYNAETFRYRICALYCGDKNLKIIFYDKHSRQSYVFRSTKEGINFVMPDFCEDSILLTDKGFPHDSPDLKYFDENLLNEEQQKIIREHNSQEDNPFIVRYYLKQ